MSIEFDTEPTTVVQLHGQKIATFRDSDGAELSVSGR
jgi:hypothetical protein